MYWVLVDPFIDGVRTNIGLDISELTRGGLDASCLARWTIEADGVKDLRRMKGEPAGVSALVGETGVPVILTSRVSWRAKDRFAALYEVLADGGSTTIADEPDRARRLGFKPLGAVFADGGSIDIIRPRADATPLVGLMAEAGP